MRALVPVALLAAASSTLSCGHEAEIAAEFDHAGANGEVSLGGRAASASGGSSAKAGTGSGGASSGGAASGGTSSGGASSGGAPSSICPVGFGDCNGIASDGCETSLSDSASDCGSCGNSCLFEHGTSSCRDGACGLESCATGYGDCDGDPNNGCEVALTTDRNHCGECGNSCTNPYSICNGGECVPLKGAQ